MKLTHVGISLYRSIGEEPVMIDLSKTITVLVGQNDCGKSNVLRGMELVSKVCHGNDAKHLLEIDLHQRKSGKPPMIRLIGEPEESDVTVLRNLGAAQLNAPVYGQFAETDWLQLLDLAPYQLGLIAGSLTTAQLSHQPNNDQILRAKRSCGQWMASALKGNFPAFQIIPQFRRIEDTGNYEISGNGIIKLLADWQHPDVGQEHKEAKFVQIEKLLRELLERPNARLEVPRSQNQIVVRDGDMRLPLESHGTGIHQLIILAIAVLSKEGIYFGIEEPEIHLHPLLQKKFLQFLTNETKNRYIITTHSPALIAPSDDVEVIHLKMIDGVTIPTPVKTDSHSLAALHDLGIRPSDPLQANAVIWVEGPSDRIYLTHWLKLVAPDLTEGIDYAIMFYGGRLLSHLTLEREWSDEADSFVRVLRINQHAAVVIDSDRKKKGDPVNKTKQRIQKECENNGLHCWITDGREIENDLPLQAVAAAYKEVTGQEVEIKLALSHKLENAIENTFPKGTWEPKWNYATSKPEWAHRIVPHIQAEDLSKGLKARLEALVEFIRHRK